MAEQSYPPIHISRFIPRVRVRFRARVRVREVKVRARVWLRIGGNKSMDDLSLVSTVYGNIDVHIHVHNIASENTKLEQLLSKTIATCLERPVVDPDFQVFLFSLVVYHVAEIPGGQDQRED